MFNIGQLAQTVQQNCNISDAQFAGNYSMCIFLLKMREYYRWENEIPLSHRLETQQVGDWIVARETKWEDIQDQQFQGLSLNGEEFDPFDSKTINQQLLPLGYVYSSGYGLFNKPHFFLAQLSHIEQHQDVTVYSSSCEFARDLVAPPAMSQNKEIFIRGEPLRRVIWEKIEEWRLKRDADAPLAKVLRYYLIENGIDPVLADISSEQFERLLDNISANETTNMIFHELGETVAGKILGQAWEEMLFQMPRSVTQFTLRAVRDHLADCHVALPQLLDSNNIASLHFYFANFTGIRRHIFPELYSAYQQWTADDTQQLRDNNILRQQVVAGQSRWKQTAKDIVTVYTEHNTTFEQDVIEIIENGAN